MNKKDILEAFDEFLYEIDYSESCCFELTNGSKCQGWIMEIRETEFLYQDSGLYGSFTDPFTIRIEDVNTETLAYWEDEIKSLAYFYGTDRQENIRKTKERWMKERVPLNLPKLEKRKPETRTFRNMIRQLWAWFTD